MPEGDIHILGADTHVPRKYTVPVVIGIGALYFLALRSRSQAGQAAGPTVDQSLAAMTQAGQSYALEFYQAQAQAQAELQQLTQANAIEQQQLNQSFQLAAGLNPGLLQQCIPLSTWYNLGNDVRSGLASQVANGQLFQTIGPNGICFAPSQAGIAGHMPLVTARSSQGLFSSSSTVTGPAGAVPGTPPAVQDPGILGVVDSILQILQLEGAYVTPTTVPRYPNPSPSQQSPGIIPGWYTPPFFPQVA